MKDGICEAELLNDEAEIIGKTYFIVSSVVEISFMSPEEMSIKGQVNQGQFSTPQNRLRDKTNQGQEEN